LVKVDCTSLFVRTNYWIHDQTHDGKSHGKGKQGPPVSDQSETETQVWVLVLEILLALKISLPLGLLKFHDLSSFWSQACRSKGVHEANLELISSNFLLKHFSIAAFLEESPGPE
jgi:hypothetical protein